MLPIFHQILTPKMLEIVKISNQYHEEIFNFLGETCNKLVLLVSYPNNEWGISGKVPKSLLLVMLVGVFYICAACCTGGPNFRPPPVYFILTNFTTPCLLGSLRGAQQRILQSWSPIYEKSTLKLFKEDTAFAYCFADSLTEEIMLLTAISFYG